MALLPRGFCAVLIVWLAATRPQAANRRESPDSGATWDAPQFTQVQAEAKTLRAAGNYAALAGLYTSAIQQAQRLKIVPAELTYRISLGNTFALLYRYPEALAAYHAARSLAEAQGRWDLAGAVAPGISSAYLQVGDHDAALEAIDRGLAAVHRLETPPYYEAGMRLQRARLVQTDPAEVRQAIEAAKGRPALQAAGWDLLADRYLQDGDYAAAQEALAMGLRARDSLAARERRSSYWRLASLRLAQGEAARGEARTRLLEAAARYNGLAEELTSELEQPEVRRQRGRIEEARGNLDAALEHYRAAVEAIGVRGSAGPLAASSLAAADRTAHETIVRSFVETAARASLREGDADLARDSFLAAEQYRAASLRHTQILAPVWRHKLPARYWQALGELNEAEAGQNGPAVSKEAIRRLRLEITEMEAHASLGLSLNQPENFLGQTSLIHFQRGLAGEELLLSFHLGEPESYVWAVSREGLRLYGLPGEQRIAALMRGFRDALLEHRREPMEALGQELYRALFGQLSRSEDAKESWLLSLEGALFDLPFAALPIDVAEAAGGAGAGSAVSKPEYLVQRHKLQVVPGALLLGKRSVAPGATYLAVGDPIYNAADPRYRGARAAVGGLNRLAASRAEIRKSASAHGGASRVLEGRDASRGSLMAAIAGGTPSVLHLSTHVVQGGARNGQAFLALSLGSKGTPELLSAADIALLQTPGSLVVMTGCASGAGQAVPGAGLLGLTRGWLVAGASAVVGTTWAIPDVSGDIVPSFFRYLREESPGAALRHSQIEAIQTNNWQADPAYWASFQITGGTR